MGLLDTMFGKPDNAQALGLLGAHMMGGNTAQGFMAANQHFAGAKQRQMDEQFMQARMGLLGAQLEETRAQARGREQQQLLAQKKQGLLDSIFGSGGVGAPAVSPGAFSPSPSEAGPMGPTMPPSMSGISAPGSRMAGLGFDQLGALKANGIDLVDLHKYANDPLKLEQGSTYQNRVTGAERYMPKVGDGIAPGRDGFYAPLPGYADSQAKIEGAKAAAVEEAKAGQDLVEVSAPDGSKRFVPRSQAVAAAQPRPMAPVGAPQGAFSGDPQMVLAAINDIKDPTERARAKQAYEQQYGPLQASPTTAQAAAAVAAQEQAKAEGRAAGEREAGRVSRGDKANDMLSNLTRAKELLDRGPTESLIGAGVDKVLSAGGMSTKGAQDASALEAISGWLVNNVPRMEGPQSNFDVSNYQTMSGKVGDRTVPIAERKSALAEIQRIQQKYAHLNGAAPQKTDSKSERTVLDALPKTAPKGQRVRDTATGEILVFNGMSWVKEK